ncbi:hypothetical protein SAMN02745115_00693 [[Eubacterium] yurii]|nr:hypothetical protein SAMN02745115_00693 [[Eubacterium] yurii]
MRENKAYYRKKLYLILVIATIVFGIHGLYEYYKLKIDNPFQLISAVLYGNIKMFLFAPPISPEADVSITYELAKWMAPILTSAFVFTKISLTLLHLKNMTVNRFSNNHILIFENTLMAETLINNLTNQKNPYKISLISKHFFDDNWKTKYEKKGIAVYQIDFENSDQNEINELMYNVNINNVKYMFFCSEVDLENYALYTNIIKRIRPKRHITCYVNCESATISTYLEDMIRQESEKEENLKNIDTVHFDKTDLTVRMLLSYDSVSKSISDKIDNLSLITEECSVEKIDDSIGEFHILMMGINELTTILLKNISNDITLSLKKNTKVSIIDNDADNYMDELLMYNEGLRKSLDLEVIDSAFEKGRLLKYLREMKKENPPSLIFILNENILVNLEMLKIVDRYFSDVPKIVRNISDVDLKYILPKNYDKIKIFGDVSQIMTQDVIISEKLDNHAKKFNDNYNNASESAGMGEGKKWNELSNVKKSSSRSSATHAKIKEMMIAKIFADKTKDEIKSYLSEKFEEFTNLQNIQREDKEEFKILFRKYLKENPPLDFLSRLEHKRWCNSYYAMNFRYGEEKDEAMKTHPCLIDDWEIVIGEKFDICHPEYDLLSVFILFQKEN